MIHAKSFTCVLLQPVTLAFSCIKRTQTPVYSHKNNDHVFRLLAQISKTGITFNSGENNHRNLGNRSIIASNRKLRDVSTDHCYNFNGNHLLSCRIDDFNILWHNLRWAVLVHNTSEMLINISSWESHLTGIRLLQQVYICVSLNVTQIQFLWILNIGTPSWRRAWCKAMSSPYSSCPSLYNVWNPIIIEPRWINFTIAFVSTRG